MPGSLRIKPNPTIFVSAGEASGDHYGAQLIAALKADLPQATFVGLGGLEMEAAGQQRVVRAEDVAHMGITEILRHIPKIYASYRRLIRAIRDRKPDVAVLIDFPDVNFRLAKELHRQGVPVVYFVSPQLWAWKKRRLRWVQERISKMMVIFPFEQPFYRARGVDAEFVGHPLAELPLPSSSREEFAAQHGLNPDRIWIALLPGSRRKEIQANLPNMLEAAKQLSLNPAVPPEMLEPRKESVVMATFHVTSPEGMLGRSCYEFLLPVASTLNPEVIREVITSLPQPTVRPVLVSDAREALHHATVGVVASGTATVQAAVIGNPFVVVYKVSPLTFRLAKKLVSYPPEIPAPLDKHGNLPIAMANLIAGRRIVPELLQENFTPEKLADLLRSWLADPAKLAAVRHDLHALRLQLEPGKPGETAISRVKAAVLQLLGETCV
ncbi:lipid-A-disaccharide synthase [Terriglobus albidus]|uniref:Lipid-A-disaccharide synthase n=1 Tax=Terriglobus albidus TaxID=1592106 RepID=A0A5B9EMM5_9BACT|nr:lipid-A-disaccharide synthase [Terriglobus albidus]